MSSTDLANWRVTIPRTEKFVKHFSFLAKRDEIKPKHFQNKNEVKRRRNNIWQHSKHILVLMVGLCCQWLDPLRYLQLCVMPSPRPHAACALL